MCRPYPPGTIQAKSEAKVWFAKKRFKPGDRVGFHSYPEVGSGRVREVEGGRVYVVLEQQEMHPFNGWHAASELERIDSSRVDLNRNVPVLAGGG